MTDHSNRLSPAQKLPLQLPVKGVFCAGWFMVAGMATLSHGPFPPASSRPAY